MTNSSPETSSSLLAILPLLLTSYLPQKSFENSESKGKISNICEEIKSNNISRTTLYTDIITPNSSIPRTVSITGTSSPLRVWENFIFDLRDNLDSEYFFRENSGAILNNDNDKLFDVTNPSLNQKVGYVYY